MSRATATHSARRVGVDATAAEVVSGIDLRGAVAVITGASTGLGAETALALAGAGAELVLSGRDLAKGERVVERIRELRPDAKVSLHALELGSEESVRAFATRVLKDHPRVRILIANAATYGCPGVRDERGRELHFAINHLGHFLLVNLVVPALRAAAPARVVVLSSSGHHFSPVVFDDLHFQHRPHEPMLAYAQSKTANALFALALDRRLRVFGVRTFAVHPGEVMTELARHMSKEQLQRTLANLPGGAPPSQSFESGAATTVFAATAPELDGLGGLYLERCAVAPVVHSSGSMQGCRDYAADPQAAERLWRVSEELVGQRF